MATKQQYPMVKTEHGVEWTYTEPTFRMGPVERTVHNGQPIEMRMCASLEDGRWEGFVSMRNLPTGEEVK
jgi:hypothetical protein